MTNLRSLPLCVLASAFFAFASASPAAIAQQTAPNVRIVSPIDQSQLVTLKGNVLPVANSANDRGPVSTSRPMQDLVLVLSRGAEQQAAFDAYVESEYDSNSPNFHRWLTAEEIGNRFGPSLTDIATITSWLGSQGFSVSHTAQDRMSITFSGTAGQVQTAFRTSIHNLSVNGVAHIANVTNPQIPAALAPVVVGIKQLHDFHPRPLHRVGNVVQFNSELGKWQRSGIPATTAASLSPLASRGVASTEAATPNPLFYSSSNGFVEEDVSPNDFATIYNVQPLWTGGNTGASQTIAIVGTSDICIGQSAAPCSSANDVSDYKTAFGLPAGKTPIIKVATGNTDPGVCTSTSSTANCGIGDLEENTLDVEVSGSVAPNAQVVLVTSAYTGSNDPIFQDAQYIEENINTSTEPVYHTHQMSVSYGLCELFEGTSGNVTYYNLWQSAAAEGLAVFVASGDSGSPACDQGQDAYGVPYSAQGGLTVSGIASTPFNTAVGGTDFSWCQPSINSQGNSVGCASTNSSPYWNNSNASNNSSAKGYVPEIPWNDTCENPIWAKFVESIATFYSASGVSTPEEACNYIQNNWYSIWQTNNFSNGAMLAGIVDTVGGGGGQSNCVVNNGDTSNNPTCTTTATSVNTGSSTVTLSGDGWPVPSWQTGVTGTSGLTSRAIPDVSLFSGDGGLDSATLICLSIAAGGTCSSSVLNNALEIGGTSVASPEMAGVMALVNQKWGAQGLPNKPFYQLAAMQTYSNCSAESSSTSGSASCYFQSIDQGNNAMPCSIGTSGAEGGATRGSSGWNITATYTGDHSPNCTVVNSGDIIGTLVSSGTTPGYSATAGFNMATGLGSLNVANVVNSNTGVWMSLGTTASTVTVTPASTSINPTQSLQVTVTVAGASGTPTGSVTLSGGGYTSAATTLTSGSASITIPAGSFSGSGNPFTVTLTANYSGDTTYAQSSGTSSVITVTKLTPTAVTVTPASGSTNSNVPLNVTVAVAGGSGHPTPTGTVTLAGGGYSSATQTLSSGAYTFTIPANTFTAGGVITLTANYSGDNVYVSSSGSGSVTVTYIQVVLPTVNVTPSPSTIYSAQSATATVSVTGTNGIATGTISLSGGGYNSAAETIGTSPCTSATNCVFTIPANSFTSVGSVTLTAHYNGDSDYLAATGTGTITVNQSSYALSATAPSSISRGSSTTSTITGQMSASSYSGTVTLSTCTLTSSTVTSPNDPPTCTVSGTITYAAGTATGSGTASIQTTAASAELIRPGKNWLGAGGGMVLALLVFFGIPARRRSWLAMLGIMAVFAVVGSLSACGGGGGGGGGGGTSNPGTTSGSYTFTVSGTSNPSVSPAPTVTFTVTVN